MKDKKFTVMLVSFRTDMPGQTVQTQIRGAVWSGSTLFPILSALFGLITLWQSHIVEILEWLQQMFWVSEYLGNLWYSKLFIGSRLQKSTENMNRFMRKPAFGDVWPGQTQTGQLSNGS